MAGEYFEHQAYDRSQSTSRRRDGNRLQGYALSELTQAFPSSFEFDATFANLALTEIAVRLDMCDEKDPDYLLLLEAYYDVARAIHAENARNSNGAHDAIPYGGTHAVPSTSEQQLSYDAAVSAEEAAIERARRILGAQ